MTTAAGRRCVRSESPYRLPTTRNLKSQACELPHPNHISQPPLSSPIINMPAATKVFARSVCTWSLLYVNVELQLTGPIIFSTPRVFLPSFFAHLLRLCLLCGRSSTLEETPLSRLTSTPFVLPCHQLDALSRPT
jgi:hypothetical protein